MPGGMNGLRLAELARERQPDLPVILATGYMNELPPMSASGRAFSVLLKPYRMAELTERIRLALKVDVRVRPAVDAQHEG
jgi:DNA-binding NtrC family response regulator